MTLIPATQEVEIWKIAVQDQSRQKSYQDPISTEQAGVVIYACDPSYNGGHK
jgi:hypothetical protein